MEASKREIRTTVDSRFGTNLKSLSQLFKFQIIFTSRKSYWILGITIRIKERLQYFEKYWRVIRGYSNIGCLLVSNGPQKYRGNLEKCIKNEDTHIKSTFL